MERTVPHLHSLSIPNLLTYARLIAVPIMVTVMFFFTGNTARWVALFIFVLAAITDFFDGYLARVWQQQSSLGRILDPIADKLLVGAAILMLVADQTISGWSIWAALIILSREILVSGLREFLAEINAMDLRVSRLAKWKTVLQMVALGFLLAGRSGEALCDCPSINIGILLLWGAAVLTLYTGFDYLSAGLKRVSEDRENSK